MDLDGLPVTLLDMAGIRETADPVEQKGIDLALRRSEAADLRLFLISSIGEGLPIALQPGDLVVLAKSDQHGLVEVLAVSGKTGLGIDRLLAAISGELAGRLALDGVVTRHRHLVAMRGTIEALERARIEVSSGLVLAELAAAEVRRAISAMDILVGKLGVEDFLGEIFANFCIGK